MPPQEFLGPRPGRLPLLRVEGSSRGSVRVESPDAGLGRQKPRCRTGVARGGRPRSNRRPEVGRGVVGGARVLFDGPDDEARTLCGQASSPNHNRGPAGAFRPIDQSRACAPRRRPGDWPVESLVGEPQTVGCRSQGGAGPVAATGLFDADAPFLVGESGTAGPAAAVRSAPVGRSDPPRPAKRWAGWRGTRPD